MKEIQLSNPNFSFSFCVLHVEKWPGDQQAFNHQSKVEDSQNAFIAAISDKCHLNYKLKLAESWQSGGAQIQRTPNAVGKKNFINLENLC